MSGTPHTQSNEPITETTAQSKLRQTATQNSSVKVRTSYGIDTLEFHILDDYESTSSEDEHCDFRPIRFIYKRNDKRATDSPTRENATQKAQHASKDTPKSTTVSKKSKLTTLKFKAPPSPLRSGDIQETLRPDLSDISEQSKPLNRPKFTPKPQPGASHTDLPPLQEFGEPINGYKLVRDNGSNTQGIPMHRRGLYINETFDYDSFYADTYRSGFASEGLEQPKNVQPTSDHRAPSLQSVEKYLQRWDAWASASKKAGQPDFSKMPLPLESGKTASYYVTAYGTDSLHGRAITTESVGDFFNAYVANEELLKLLKRERIKWHPDKWTGHLLEERISGQTKSRKNEPTDDSQLEVPNLKRAYLSIIEHVCQIIVGLLDELSSKV
ncbi:hypothetical protein BABINDRAFT_162321 [Babjeviella inositovora NRRL Y-12698]|uniref:Uncharacterized protein n=1 Tax=Babjeviella inositovora NRRL Y-12698 TaxID=984486 RepID=A0A1E3QPB5_9ASCO|nr:uncharacterized protein BABINDRAFT_162321 [Babjeviella inositovora NRRL Y-12698]ODQ79294.1 hypothetical protein BABINDRAFT_162321 [Babjeviella inositovora NRRL Y-12698]